MSVNQVKTLFLEDGITVSPPANVMTASGSFVSYADDAAFVTGKGSAAADGDAYYNTTEDVVRYYSDGVWSTFIDNDSSQNISGKTVTDNMVFSSTGAIKLPSGTTGQRPTPSAGQIRYNSTTGGFEGYTDKWGSIGGGATPIAIDHTTTSLELNSFYAIDMSGASGNVTFTFPDMVDGDQFKALVFGNDTNGYLATFQTTSPQNMYYRGSTDTSIQLTVADTWVGGLWDNNNSYAAIYDASTFLSGTLAGDWDIEGSLTVDTDTLVVDKANGRVGINTASPSTYFQVDANGADTALHTIGILDANQGVTGAAKITFQATRNDSVAASRYAVINADDGGSTARQLKIQNNGGDAYFGGNVGIGGTPTTIYSVQNKLSIFGNYGIGIKADVTSGNSRVQGFVDGDDTACGSITIDATANTTAFGTSSDKNLKNDLGDWNALQIINECKARKYERKSNQGVSEYGFFAQELYLVVPQAVIVGSDDFEKDPWMVDYSKVTSILWKAIQEQQTLIESQQQQLEAQQVIIEDLLSRVSKLEGGN